nr:retrovirus-related Pol polyprotein from transposon TNT 1-94 [Tanacetum cinerariifolium]
MTGNLKLLINFVWKFMGTVRFRNDHVAAILGKSKRASHPPKPVPNSRQRLHLLHMDLCGLMRIASINVKRKPYISFLHVFGDLCYPKNDREDVGKLGAKGDIGFFIGYSADSSRKKQKSISSTKASAKFEAEITSSSYGFVWTNENCQYKWKAVYFGDCRRLLSLYAVLKVYFDSVDISHQMSSVRTPQQNGVVEQRNRTLVEAARTMLIFSRAPLFLWTEAIATACFTQNRSIIHHRFNKTPYELINGRKPDISFLHVFGALCYPKNDREDIGKLGAKGDIGFFIGYSVDSCAYRIYNRRSKKIIETMNVSFDELSAMAFEQRSSKPGLQSELDLLFETMYDDYFGGQPSSTARTVPPVQEPQVHRTSTTSTTIADNVPIPTNSSSHATNILITLQDVDELTPNAMIDGECANFKFQPWINVLQNSMLHVPPKNNKFEGEIIPCSDFRLGTS